MTVLEVIQRSTEFLAKKGVESARLQTELLLADVLKLPRMQLYLNFERSLTTPEVETFRELIRRRGQREPLQHILGSTSFCGLEMTVSRHALIPRPETELLAEHGWTFLNQLPSPADTAIEIGLREDTLKGGHQTNPGVRCPPFRVSGPDSMAITPSPLAPTALDFGTGSGCLAIPLASKSASARVQAVDVSPEALALARQNAARHGLAGRIEFHKGDGFAALQPGARFDLIISNPPYIPSAEIETLQREVRDHDPRPALDGGPDGMDYFRRLAAEAAAFLRPGGKLMLEFGDGQAGDVGRIFQQEMWIVEATRFDYSQRPRILIARRADSNTNEST